MCKYERECDLKMREQNDDDDDDDDDDGSDGEK